MVRLDWVGSNVSFRTFLVRTFLVRAFLWRPSIFLHLIAADGDDEEAEEDALEDEEDRVEDARLLHPHRVPVRVAHH